MTYLLDTHVAIWVVAEPEKLSPTVRRISYDPTANLLLSVASVWELVIKSMLGKLDLDDSIPSLINELLKRGNVTVIPVSLQHALRVQALPPQHKDPFDRMLVAQSLYEDVILLTADPIVRQYPARTDW